jgi:hypothetical protein
VSGTENERKRRWSLLAQASPTCLRAGATGETWAGRRESGTGGSGADIQSDRGASAQTLATS